SIRRIRRAESARHRQRFRKSAVDADRPKTEVSLLRRTVAHGRKDHPPAIRRPAARPIQTGMVCQTFWIAARRWDQVNIGITSNGCRESDLRSIRRKVWIDLDALR